MKYLKFQNIVYPDVYYSLIFYQKQSTSLSLTFEHYLFFLQYQSISQI
jgi:hypothetical protein